MKADELDRITHDRDVMSGRACIRGMPVTVSLVLGLLAEGESTEDIIAAHPDLEPEDVKQSIKYAADLAEKHIPRFPKDDAWITEKLNEVYSKEDSSLDPALAAMQWASLEKSMGEEDWSEARRNMVG